MVKGRGRLGDNTARRKGFVKPKQFFAYATVHKAEVREGTRGKA